jgi:AraC family transcriptional regulator, regulatory protein of adaptative response / DNA-3-methyladenine glycosylase II
VRGRPYTAGAGSVQPSVDHERQRVVLSYQPPLAFDALLEFLGARAVPGVEEVADGAYRRVLRLPGGPGVVDLAHSATSPTITCRLRLADPRDSPAAVAACRRLLDLDADLVAVDRALAGDPVLGPLVTATPGRRAPGHVDADELAIRAVLGQQVTLAAARGLAARLTDLCGERLAQPDGGLTCAFPSAVDVADADLDRLGMPGSRRATIRTLTRALADGDIRLVPDAGANHDEVHAALLGLRGIGPWTAAYIRMRGLGDPDVFLAGDVGVRRALAAVGIADGAADGDRWRPRRSYAVHHLWASLS